MKMEPLASKIRPTDLADFAGQTHLVGDGKPLRTAMQNRHIFSFILWGPPGVGKTTLAKMYAAAVGAKLFELSAVSAKKDDIKKVLAAARSSATRSSSVQSSPAADPSAESSPAADSAQTSILFLDEIHRFNKAQQDFLLPFVENGELTLIGATTENPSFEVIPALLSRCRVFVLESLSPDDMNTIITRTGIEMGGQARDWLIAAADGDARQLLTVLEHTTRLYGEVTTDTLKKTVQSKHLRYDKAGDEHYNTISAFIKSMRAGQANAALYYLARMLDAGEDPKFIARRMVVFASEDVGLAVPTALVVANAIFRAVETIGLPECEINLAHGVAYLCGCKKDRRAYNALRAAQADVKAHGNLPVPMSIRNAPTKLMKELGYGAGYEKYTDKDLLPEKLRGRKYLE